MLLVPVFKVLQTLPIKHVLPTIKYLLGKSFSLFEYSLIFIF